MLPATVLNIKAIPPLATKSQIQLVLEQLKGTQNTIVSVSLMMLISGPIQQILSSFRHTQVTVHIMLIQVNQPATSLVFFGGLMNLVNFQLLDTSNTYNKMFRLDPESPGNSPLNSQFDLMGYDSLYIV